MSEIDLEFLTDDQIESLAEVVIEEKSREGATLANDPDGAIGYLRANGWTIAEIKEAIG